METSAPQNRVTLALRRVVVTILGTVRRLLASIYQVAFRDRLRAIDEKTDRLGSASVESVTYLGGEVQALDQRLARIEAELASLRELLERREGSAESAGDPDEIPAGPSAG